MARKAGKGTGFTIQGLDKATKSLRALPPAVAKKVVRQSMRKALKPVAQAVRQEAPEKSGALKRAIKVRAGKRTSKGVIRLQVRVGAGDFKGDTFYGAFQQFGTKKIPANDFMTRGFEATAEGAKDEAERLIVEGLEDQVRKLGSKG